jgi:hypothetical protein
MGGAFNQCGASVRRVRARRGLHLGLGQPPVLPRRQAPEQQRPERHALERDHRMPDRLAHAPDLALAALVDRDLQAIGSEPPHARRRGAPVLQLDALT